MLEHPIPSPYDAYRSQLVQDRSQKQQELDALNDQQADGALTEMEKEELGKDISLINKMIAYAEQGINPLKAKLELQADSLAERVATAQTHLDSLGDNAASDPMQAMDFEETQKDLEHYTRLLAVVNRQIETF
jgi:septal ring factor EnvC (AmiA/AmiB activator)